MMNPNVPAAVDAFFVLTTLLAAILLWLATRSKGILTASLLWITLQSAISLKGFYTQTRALPPHLVLALAPPVLAACILALLPAGKRLIDSMDLKWTVLLHIIRLPVEVTLYLLFLSHQVPRLMTFEGGNLDILAGLTAPMAWWAFRTRRIGNRGLLVWNIVFTLTLLNVVIRALLSAPFPFQKLAYSQPNVAILYFPFTLLPALVVPAVLFCHLALYRKTRS